MYLSELTMTELQGTGKIRQVKGLKWHSNARAQNKRWGRSAQGSTGETKPVVCIAYWGKAPEADIILLF
jgi:hypothetical protein